MPLTRSQGSQCSPEVGSNRELGVTRGRGVVEVVDVHVGGDLHRIVVGGVKTLPGASTFEKMEFLRSKADGLRQLLLMEPRGGHPSLYADLVVEPSHPDANAGFIIMELMGYPVISGTNTMSTAVALLETDRLPKRDGMSSIVLEAPGGLIRVQAECQRDRVKSITYQAATPSFVAESDLSIVVPAHGTVKFDIIWTGAFYPVIDASALGFSLTRSEEEALVRFANEFLSVARAVHRPTHPEFGNEGPLSFVVFVGDPQAGSSGVLERRVCCYEHPRRSVCRSPAGVPSTAATLQLAHRGLLKVGDTLRTISTFGMDLRVTLLETVPYNKRQGARVSVTGTGWVVARSQLVIDFDDPMTPGDGLAAILVDLG